MMILMAMQLSWLERALHKRQVPGSSPGIATINFPSNGLIDLKSDLESNKYYYFNQKLVSK